MTLSNEFFSFHYFGRRFVKHVLFDKSGPSKDPNFPVVDQAQGSVANGHRGLGRIPQQRV